MPLDPALLNLQAEATATLSGPARMSNGGFAQAAHAGKTQALRVQDEKLKKAAVEFESILISTFWKSMKNSFGEDDDSADPAHETIDDIGMQAMSQAMAKGGGLGLGRLILKHLEARLPGAAHEVPVARRNGCINSAASSADKASGGSQAGEAINVF